MVAPVLALSLVVSAATGIQYGVLQALVRILDRIPPRAWLRIQLAMAACLVAHAAEIGCYAAAFFVLGRVPGSGFLGGEGRPSLLDCAYFSAQTFTAVGYGDIIAHGPLRILSMGESLDGLLLLGWSVTFSMRVRQGVELLRS